MQRIDAVTKRNAAIDYLAAWVIGLAVWPTNLGLNAPASAVASSHHEHAAQAVASYALTEGVAGLLLAVVVAGLTSQRAVRSGTAAAAISVLQCFVGIGTVVAAGDHEVGLSGTLFGLVNHLDGLKMLLLAFAAASELGSGRPRTRWFGALSLAAASALLVSGVAYLALLEPLAWTAFISGPLLLGWVMAVGVRSRRAALAQGLAG
jgi:hypothetical protein